MDLELSHTSVGLVKCCECGCSCSMMNRSFSGTYLRSVKRKYDEFEEEGKVFTIPGLDLPLNARVDIENECNALRETVASHQQTIQDLISELEEERNAASSAAEEAMSMILRIQREKSEIQMEARQFKRFAEEKMAHDQREMTVLEELLYKREQTIQSLTCEVHAYKHRMMSYGLTENEADGANMSRNNSMMENFDEQIEMPPYEIYPPLKCKMNEFQGYPDGDEEEKYAFGETPRSRDQLKDLEYRINQLEKSPRINQPDGEYVGAKNVFEKVIFGQSPRRPRHVRKFSTDSSDSLFGTGKEDFATDSPRFGTNVRKTDLSHIEAYSKLRKVDNILEAGDDMGDRIYTIDSFGGRVERKASNGVGADDYMTAPRDSLNHNDVRDLEIQKLYARLHALETDRESMRQAIISVGTDKAQLVLLKEIAQNLCKEMSPAATGVPMRKQSAVRSFSFVALFKWIISFIFWRRKARRCRYMFGLSANNAGLLTLLDRGPRIGQWRRLSDTKLCRDISG